MFFIMMDHEKSAGNADTLEEARIIGQRICDSEILPTTFSIYEDETFIEDIKRTDGLGLSDQISRFNQVFGKLRGD